MTITILTTGSRGDVQPYLALALQLKAAGQHVRVAAFENYASFVTGLGLDFSPIRGDINTIIGGEVAQEAMQSNNPLKVMLSFQKLKQLAAHVPADVYQACLDSDALVYHPGNAIAYFAARQLGIPSILATPFPMTPTRAYPALIFYNGPRLGNLYNLLSHRLFEQIMWIPSSEAIKQFWRARFGTLPPEFGMPFSRQQTAQAPTLIACSPHVFPTPSDWPEHVYNTGYWFLDEEPGWQPTAELETFLAAGPAPIYIGFGSVGVAKEAREITRMVIEALDGSGQRGILASGWGGLSTEIQLPANIFMLERAPHAWLFPRMAAVIHHGGAGTTAAGLRAGVPSILIPHGNDQFAWGRRVHELGVAPKPIPRKQLTAMRLQSAIQQAAAPAIQQAARELGAKIQAENGAAKAAQIVIDTLKASQT